MGTQSRSVEIAAPGGAMPAYLAEPDSGGPFPAVLVFMEAFGLVPHIRDVTDRLAAEGYVALAPDVYYRALPNNKVGYDQLDRAIALMQGVDDERFVADARAVLKYLAGLESVADRIGVTGFCMGGRLTFLLACELPDQIAAAASFYGGGIAGHLGRAGRIRAPLLLFFAGDDPYIPPDQVKAIDAKLGELGKDYRLKTYPGTGHGFFCDERESYAPDAARDAWIELTRFFGEHLIGAGG